MPFQPGAVVNTQCFANRPESVEVPHLDVRAPTTLDFNYPIGKHWIDTVGLVEYTLVQISTAGAVTAATWEAGAGGSSGISSILGTANQVTASTTAGVTTLSTPATFIAPGSIQATTTLTATGGLTTLAALTQVGTTNINASGSADTNLGTGSSGTVNLGGLASNGVFTPNDINITGDGSRIRIKASNPGSDAIGVTAAMTTGAVTTACACSAASIIFYVRKITGGTPGEVSITAQGSNTFTLTSTSGSETSTFNYIVFN